MRYSSDWPRLLYNPWEPSNPLNFTDYANRYFADDADTKSGKLQQMISNGKYDEYCSGNDWQTDVILSFKLIHAF